MSTATSTSRKEKNAKEIIISLVREEKSALCHDLVISWVMSKLRRHGLDRKTKTGRSYISADQLYLGVRGSGINRTYGSYGYLSGTLDALLKTLIKPIINRLVDKNPLTRKLNGVYVAEPNTSRDGGINYLHGFCTRRSSSNRDTPHFLEVPVTYYSGSREYKVIGRYLRILNRLLISAKIPLSLRVILNRYDSAESYGAVEIDSTALIQRGCFAISIDINTENLPIRHEVESRNYMWLAKLYGNINSVTKVCQTLIRFSLESICKRIESIDSSKEVIRKWE